jgi:hypothetical protein
LAQTAIHPNCDVQQKQKTRDFRSQYEKERFNQKKGLSPLRLLASYAPYIVYEDLVREQRF